MNLIAKYFYLNRPSFKVGSILNIPVYVSPWLNWVLILAFAFGCFWGGLWGGAVFAFCVSLIYFFVLVHEFGHILTARRYGHQNLRVYMYPMGGLASHVLTPQQVARMRPKTEFWITFNGPLTNFCWLVLLFPLILTGFWIFYFAFVVNFFMLLFNCIPVFPLDGSKILRSIIQMWTGKRFDEATKIVYYTGLWTAIPLGIIAILTGRWFIGFILIGFAINGKQHWQQAEQIQNYRRDTGYGVFGNRQPGEFAAPQRDVIQRAAQAAQDIDDLLRRTR